MDQESGANLYISGRCSTCGDESSWPFDGNCKSPRICKDCVDTIRELKYTRLNKIALQKLKDSEAKKL